jgi:D-serine deaminase-like pyridoxal phosphate-dependent protein
MKTAKSADVARRVLPEGGGPITVSTLREAEYFAAHGFNDVFYAVALAPQKLDRAIRLVRNGTRLLLAVDDSSIAAVIDQGGRRSRTQLKVMIEIDSGEHRSGVAADSPALLEMPRPWVQTHGLLASSHTAVIRIRAARQMSKPRWPSRSGPQ